MENKKKNKKLWSKKYYQTKIDTWNCWSLSNERYHYCRELKFDILGLTELHNAQAKEQFKHKTWIHSAPAAVDANGKCSDPAAGVAIMLSPRMADKILDSGHVGTRIAWVRLKGPVCNIFYIVSYVPHKGRTIAPKAEDTIAQLSDLLQTVKKSECVILAGDFNCQLQRSVPGCTGKWCMTKYENKGHGSKILDLMRAHDLCAIDSYFKPKRKKWSGRYRHCNATYIPKNSTRRPTKLDYLCVSNRWKNMVINAETKWAPSIHRFGHKFDHALLSATWRWRTKKTEQIGRPDYEAMDEQRWAAFDCDLRIRMERSRQVRYEASQSTVGKTCEDTANGELQEEYAHLTNVVRESIDATVPSKTRTKKNGRIVSDATKALYEKRTKQYQANKPNQAERKRWNRKIRASCKKDYRTWVTKCTEQIEKADNSGDTKTIYSVVKRLSGLVSRGANTRPTTEYQECGAAEAKRSESAEELASKSDTNTRSSEKQELASKSETETAGLPRNDESKVHEEVRKNETVGETVAANEELDGESFKSAAAKKTPRGERDVGHS